MSTQQYDANGNPIFSTSAIGSPDQQVSDSNGIIINPSREDGNLLSIKTDLDQLTFTSGALNVNIASGVTLTVALDHSSDNVLVYGNDGTTDRKLLTNASGNLQVGITNSTLAVIQSGVWSTGRTWTLANGTDSVSAVQSGTWNINNISGTVSLPTGASTEATLLAIKTDTDKFTFTATRLLVDGSGVTQPISAVSLPLPTGASTSAKQPALGTAGVASTDVLTVQGIASMTPLKVDGSGVTQPVSGTVTVGNATLAVTQSGTWTTGRTWTLSNGTDSINVGNFPATQPVSGTVTATQGSGNALTPWTVNGTITANIGTTNGLALDSTLSTLSAKFVTGTVIGDVNAAQKGTWNITNVSGTVSLPTGAATETTLAGIKTDTDKLTFTSTRLLVDGSGVTQPISAASLPLPTGAATETTLGTRLADSTFTGRINTLGQKTSANSTPVVIASDQTAIPASQSGVWSTRTQDGSGNAITSSTFEGKQALDVNNVDNLQELVLAGKHFVTVVEVNLTTTTETAFFYFKNPTGSGKNVYLRSVSLDTATKGGIVTARLYKNPTTSANGTAATVVNLDIQASPTAAVATPFTSPTASAFGSKIDFLSTGANAVTAIRDYGLGILVEPNNSVVVTGVPDANNRIAVIVLDWVEI